ncbi:MAG: L-aspartate--glyoxylate aminotransferase BhcA, partial [Pseudomonadota bacterium]
RRAIDFPSLDHRSATFVDMFTPLRAGVRRILKSKDAEVVIFPATGTAGWEAAITNTLSPGDTVLAARHGMFSHRWIDLCERHELNVVVVEGEWGDGTPVDAYERILKADKDHQIKAVLATHNETATGVRSDMRAVRTALDRADHPALFMVDGVSSIASMDFRMDEWGVDLAVTGSQKGFMLPAGLAIVGISQKAMNCIADARGRRCFLDFRMMIDANDNGGYPYTPAVNLLRGLSHSIEMLENEGLHNVFARHFRIAEGVRQATRAWGLKLCAKNERLYSDTVSAIMVPEGFNANEIVTHAAERYGVAFGVGLGEVAGKVFRIGHLGSMTDVMALSGIATAEMVMADLEIPFEMGSGVAAAANFYRRTSQQAVVQHPRRAA